MPIGGLTEIWGKDVRFDCL